MAVKFSNNGKTTLSAGITSSATSISVTDGSVFPTLGSGDSFYMTLEDGSGNNEIVSVTAVSTNTLTVTRAQEGTTARAFSSGDKAENRLTAAGLNSFVSDSGDTVAGTLNISGNTRQGSIFNDSQGFNIVSDSAGNDPLFLESPGSTGTVRVKVGGNTKATFGASTTTFDPTVVTINRGNSAGDILLLRAQNAQKHSFTNAGATISGSLIAGGSQITSSSATFQNNGFMRTGRIHLHEGNESPTTNDKELNNVSGVLKWDSYTVWHNGNDGSGSGLDADKLDGYQLDGSTSIGTRIFNNKGQTHGTVTNFNTAMTPGPNYIQGATNGPESSGQFYGFMLGLGTEYGTTTGSSGHYAAQMYFKRNASSNANYLYMRSMENGSWGSWLKVSAGYADSAGNADTLDGVHASNFVRKSGLGSSNYYSADTWLEFYDTNSGLYWNGTQTGNQWHIYPASSADMYMRSGSSSQVGLALTANSTTARGYVYANSSNEIGFLNNNRDWRLKGTSAGTWTATADFRAPIFYDSNDTTYKLNPAGNSIVNSVAVSGNYFQTSANDGCLTLWGTASSTTSRMSFRRNDSSGVNWGGHGDVTDVYATYFEMDTSGRGWVFRNATTASNVASISNLGRARFAAVGINTNPRTDGYNLSMGGSVHMNNYQINYVQQLHFNDNVRFYDDGNDSYLNFKFGDTGSGGIKIHNGSNELCGYWYATSSQEHGFLDNDGNWAVRIRTSTNALELRCNNNVELQVFTSYSHAPGSFRAPLFYDSQDTNYYGDFNSYTYVKYLGRKAHHTGHLVGSYNSVGANSQKTNPIYTIGSSYNPNDDTLGNMYGVGYTHTNADIINMSGTGSGWGFYVAADGDARGFWNGSQGHFTTTGNVTAYASDQRLKTNVKTIDNALDKVTRIRGVEFDWVDDITSEYEFYPQQMHETGVLAQEIQEVIPDAVVEAPFNSSYTAKSGVENNFLTVDKEKIIPLLIEAIKELKAEVDALKGASND